MPDVLRPRLSGDGELFDSLMGRFHRSDHLPRSTADPGNFFSKPSFRIALKGNAHLYSP
jgi:hypothetical protein